MASGGLAMLSKLVSFLDYQRSHRYWRYCVSGGGFREIEDDEEE
jgi:hypothetical protein